VVEYTPILFAAENVGQRFPKKLKMIVVRCP